MSIRVGTMILGLLLVGFLQVGPSPFPAPVPPPNIINVVVQAPPPDPQAIADASVESGQSMLTSIIVPPPVNFTNELLNLPDLWRTTPASLTYQHPEIRTLSETMRLAALGLLALAVFAVGVAYALGQHDIHAFGRIIFALILSAFSLTWWEVGIRLNNALCAMINAPDLPSIIRPHVEFAPLDPAGSVTTVVLVLVYSIVALMLLFSLLFRLGMIMVLIALGPLALLMYATPQTEYLGQRYTQLVVGFVFSQVLIVVGLRLAVVLSSVGSGVAGTLLSIVILLLIRQLPALVSSGGRAQNGGRSMLSSLAGLIVLRRFRFR